MEMVKLIIDGINVEVPKGHYCTCGSKISWS